MGSHCLADSQNDLTYEAKEMNSRRYINTNKLSPARGRCKTDTLLNEPTQN